MKTTPLLLAVCAFVATSASANARSHVPREIYAFIKSQGEKRGGVGRLTGLLRADLNGQKRYADLVAQYSVDSKDGGNFSGSFIAAFVSVKGAGSKQFAGEVSAGIFGTATGEQLSLKRTSGRRVVCERFVYEADSGVCCPTPKGFVTLELQNGRLRRASR